MEQNQEKNLTNEEAQEKIKQLRKAIEENRIPLNESLSSDVVSRINALTKILDTKVSLPKYTTQKVAGKNIETLSGSVEISLFPSYGMVDEQYREWCYNNFINVMARLSELVAKL